LSDAWQALDLGGGGLQQANLALARRLKRRRRAYFLLAVAPLGLHRAYLEDRRGAWLWRAAAAAFTAAALLDLGAAVAAAALLVAALAYDAWWIDRRVTAINKRIRQEVYLSQAANPPPGFAGRTFGEPGGRAPSFSEQEQLLRELAKRRGTDASAR
jgi:hypothetical protein